MIHVEVKGMEMLIVKIEDEFSVVDDRCAHLNALLSKGSLDKTIFITCPRHFSSFDLCFIVVLWASTGISFLDTNLASFS
jgi:nitrite reductase/ring-hydroxylating ferredoxin subunit